MLPTQLATVLRVATGLPFQADVGSEGSSGAIVPPTGTTHGVRISECAGGYHVAVFGGGVSVVKSISDIASVLPNLLDVTDDSTAKSLDAGLGERLRGRGARVQRLDGADDGWLTYDLVGSGKVRVKPSGAVCDVEFTPDRPEHEAEAEKALPLCDAVDWIAWRAVAPRIRKVQP